MEARMLLLYRNGEHIPVQQVAKEFRAAASDAVDQKPVFDFLGIAARAIAGRHWRSMRSAPTNERQPIARECRFALGRYAAYDDDRRNPRSAPALRLARTALFRDRIPPQRPRAPL